VKKFRCDRVKAHASISLGDGDIYDTGQQTILLSSFGGKVGAATAEPFPLRYVACHILLSTQVERDREKTNRRR